MPERPSAGRIAAIVGVFVLGLLAVALLRFLNHHLQDPPILARYATLLYVGVTIVAAVLLIRARVPFERLGFGRPIRPLSVLVLALAGVAVLQFAGWSLTPLWELLFGGDRDLSRFADVGASPSALLALLAVNWTVAAFGEELAFRIVLMRSIAFLFGDTRRAFIVALLGQAIVFGLVHAYQGPTGVASSTISGLVFGTLVLVARGSIWPAAIAHGGNNTIGILRLYFGG